MLHRGRFGLGWRHLHPEAQATLSDLAITCQARIPDYLAKNSMVVMSENRSFDHANIHLQKPHQFG